MIKKSDFTLTNKLHILSDEKHKSRVNLYIGIFFKTTDTNRTLPYQN